MARPPKPWYREDRQAWFVTIDGTRHNLGPDEQEAKRKFHEIMARPREARKPVPVVTAAELVVLEVLDKFLEWCQKNRAAKTYQWYQERIQWFLNFKPAVGKIPANEIKPFHVLEWIDSKADTSSTFRRGCIIAVQRPFNWAHESGYIQTNPIKSIKKPQAERRDNHMTPEDYKAFLALMKEGDPFRDLCEFAWHTGCRPQEARLIEVDKVNFQEERIEIPPKEAKGKKRWRIIHLDERALAIVMKRCQDRTCGKVFLNRDGNPWKAYAIGCRFYRLKTKLGKRFAAYDIRHGFCQRMLENGNDHLTVAELMGHVNGQVVSSNYSHMHKADEHLRKALKKGADGET